MCTTTRRLVITAATVLLAVAAGGAFASGDPQDIAMEMLRANEAVSAVKGTFAFSGKVRQQPVQVQEQFDGLIASADSDAMREQLIRAKDMAIAAARESGFIGSVEQYTGALDGKGRLRIEEETEGPEGKDTRLYISDGEKALCYSSYAKVAELMNPQDNHSVIYGKRSTVRAVAAWIDSPNYITSKDHVSVLEEKVGSDGRMVVLEQKPTGTALGQFRAVYEVCLDKGYLSRRTEIYYIQTGRLIRVIENRDIGEIRPGIWRPMERTDTWYSLDKDGNVVPSHIASLSWKGIEGVNAEVDEEQFTVVAPLGVTAVVDSRHDVDVELDVDPESGIDGIEETLSSIQKGEVPQPAEGADAAVAEVTPMEALKTQATEQASPKWSWRAAAVVCAGMVGMLAVVWLVKSGRRRSSVDPDRS